MICRDLIVLLGCIVVVGDVLIAEIGLVVVVATVESMYIMLCSWCTGLGGGYSSRTVDEADMVMYIQTII